MGAGFGSRIGEPSFVTIELRRVPGGTRVRIAETAGVGASPERADDRMPDHDAVFQALADPTRRTLLRTLSASGPSTLDRALSGHARCRARPSRSTSRCCRTPGSSWLGREVRGRRYELTPAPLADALGWMVDVGAGWDDRLARLKRQVEARRR